MSKKKQLPPAFQFYPKDWIVKTRAMSLAARGAYVDLLANAWLDRTMAGGVPSLPNDEPSLRRIIGATEQEWSAIREELLAKFEAKENRLINPRLVVVADGLSKFLKNQRDKGRAGAKARWSPEDVRNHGRGNGRDMALQSPVSNLQSSSSLRDVDLTTTDGDTDQNPEHKSAFDVENL